jgi:hypothetical protein
MNREVMAHQPSRLYELGGLSLVVSGALFFSRSLLEARLGFPPSSGTEIIEWARSQKLLLSLVNEVFLFAVVFMIPGVVALSESLFRTHRGHAAIGGGVLATTIPVMVVLGIVHGRLMYPMFGIQAHAPEIAEFIVATYHGGLHAVALMHAVATVALSLALGQAADGRRVARLGWASAALDVAGAYPDAVGPTVVLVASGFLSAWFVAVGLRLYRAPAPLRS